MNKIWFGKIPNDWKTIKAKFLFSERCEKGNSINLEILTPSQKFGVLPQKKYQEVTGIKPVQVNENTDLSNFKTVHKNDYCISLSAYMGGFEYSEYEGVISPAYHSFYQIDDIYDNNYLKKLFKSSCFIDEINCITPNSVRVGRNTSFEKFGNILMPIPTKEEQNKIANFLDNKILVIDNVIEKTRETIEDYKKYKQSVITEMVTKGCDKNAVIKDSGNKWIKLLPLNWKISKMKYFSKEIGDGLHATPDYDENGKIYFVNGNNIGNEYLVFKADTNKINDREYQKYKLPLLNSQTILIALNGATYGKISLYNMEKILLGKSAGYITYKNDVNRKFMSYYMLSYFSKELMTYSLNGTTIQNLSLDTLRNFICFVPPLEEQNKVVEYLDKKCIQIDKLISSKEKIIEELEQYKKSLIYEYVTGKKEVI